MEKIAERDRLVFNAHIAAQTKRYNDVVNGMEAVAKLGVELSVEERNLLFIGYENVFDAKRASWRIVSTKSKEEGKGETKQFVLAKEALERWENELTSNCREISFTIDKYLLPSSNTKEANVFYNKMKGDYYRYLAEFKSNDAEREEVTSQAEEAYKAATAIAETDLPITNPMRLGLALNVSVFYHVTMAETERARDIAKQAIKDAASELDKKSHPDSYCILQLIRENYSMWTREAKVKAREQQKKSVDGKKDKKDNRKDTGEQNKAVVDPKKKKQNNDKAAADSKSVFSITKFFSGKKKGSDGSKRNDMENKIGGDGSKRNDMENKIGDDRVIFGKSDDMEKKADDEVIEENLED